MKKYLIVTADQNDADFVTRKTEITDEKLELIKPVIEAIKQQGRGFTNWATGDCVDDRDPRSPEDLYIKTGILTPQQVEWFEDFVPYGMYGVHSIDYIELLIVQEEFKLL